MAIFNSGKAKELSKSTKSVARVISSNGQKNVVKGTAKKPDINIIPKASQTRKVIKTYDKGQLVKKEKQGHDILGRPTTKQKTYVDGKVTSVVKRVAGNNKDTKIVREAGKKQVSKSPAMPKMKNIGVAGTDRVTKRQCGRSNTCTDMTAKKPHLKKTLKQRLPKLGGGASGLGGAAAMLGAIGLAAAKGDELNNR